MACLSCLHLRTASPVAFAWAPLPAEARRKEGSGGRECVALLAVINSGSVCSDAVLSMNAGVPHVKQAESGLRSVAVQ